jgi:hypothetical protein
MIYTLIMTAVFIGYGPHIVHVEHAYSTNAECKKAYEIASEQFRNVSGFNHVEGTCLQGAK